MKKLILLVLAVILIASVSAQTCTECQAIDQAWQGMFNLIGVKNEFYNPHKTPQPGWQSYSTYLGQSAPATATFDSVRTQFIAELDSAITIEENSLLPILNNLKSHSTNNVPAVLTQIDSLINQEQTKVNNLKNILAPVLPGQVDQVHVVTGNLIFNLENFITSLNTKKTEISNSINPSQVSTHLDDIIARLNTIIQNKRTAKDNLTISRYISKVSSGSDSQTFIFLQPSKEFILNNKANGLSIELKNTWAPGIYIGDTCDPNKVVRRNLGIPGNIPVTQTINLIEQDIDDAKFQAGLTQYQDFRLTICSQNAVVDSILIKIPGTTLTPTPAPPTYNVNDVGFKTDIKMKFLVVDASPTTPRVTYLQGLKPFRTYVVGPTWFILSKKIEVNETWTSSYGDIKIVDLQPTEATIRVRRLSNNQVLDISVSALNSKK